ncbi:MAG: hypothetical protein ABMA64_36980, partial [Myxococcota bacterium]
MRPAEPSAPPRPGEGEPDALSAAIEPLPDLPPEATLAEIQHQARQIVRRTAALADRAQEVLHRVMAAQRRVGPAGTPLGTRASTAADRAGRAADAAASAAALIELDEDSGGAAITLDLVRNAELQCESALTDATTQLREIERAAEREQAQARALAEASRRAADHANRATDLANQADELVSAVEDELRTGRLTAAATRPSIDAAIGAAERAHAAAEEARAQAEAAGKVRPDLALRHAELARRSEEEASRALDETRAAVHQVRRAEVEDRERALIRIADAVSAARTSAEQAQRALTRAFEATHLTTVGDPSAVELESECKSLSRAAADAAADAEAKASMARASDRAADAHAVVAAVEEAAQQASRAARESTALSDRIVELAGAAAEARARVAKLREEAVALRERAKSAVSRAREELERLQQETSQLTVPEAVDLCAEAAVAFHRAESEVAGLEAPALQVSNATSAEVATPIVEQMRAAAVRAHHSIDAARAAVITARTTAENELAELRRREAARSAVAAAAAEAREMASRCRARVDDAWRVAKNLSDTLQRTEVDEAVRNRSKALEIIDIAEFQAGEAAASADLAARESDPAEARAHAQTAQSFLDRITADLPEALEALALAETLAVREIDGLAAARAKTADAAAAVEAIRRDADTLRASIAEDSAPWLGDEAVRVQLGLLDQAVRATAEDINESSWARDRAASAGTWADAAELVPNAEAASNRAREKKRKIDALADSVRRAITAAEADANAIIEARRSAAAALEAVRSDLGRLSQIEQRLRLAISTHGARGEVVVNSELRVREVDGELRRAVADLEALVATAATVALADEARRLGARSGDLRRAAERSLELATEAEGRGTAAAEQESRARAEARNQRLAAHREVAIEQAGRAEQVVQRLSLALTEARVAAPDSESTRARFDEIERAIDALRGQLPEFQQLVDGSRASTELEPAEALAERSRHQGDRLASDGARIASAIQEVIELARAAAQEAIALQSLRAEIATTADKATEAVERARAEAARLPSAIRDAPHLDPRALSDEADQHVLAASKAAAKVRAAVPLAVSYT